MSLYMSCQVDLLNLDNFYPLQIKQKIPKSIIKISFATAQISSRFSSKQFFQKIVRHTKKLSSLSNHWQPFWITLLKFSIKSSTQFSSNFLELFAHNHHFDWLFFFPPWLFFKSQTTHAPKSSFLYKPNYFSMTTHLDAMHVCETRGGDSHIKLCINVFHTKITGFAKNIYMSYFSNVRNSC